MLDSNQDDFLNSVYKNITTANDLNSTSSQELHNMSTLSMQSDFENQETHPTLIQYHERNFFNVKSFDSEFKSFDQDLYLHPPLTDDKNVLSTINLNEVAFNFNIKIKHFFDEPKADCFFYMKQPYIHLNLRSNILQSTSFGN
jgi:hypothetical protein